jgi:hypothetical protein
MILTTGGYWGFAACDSCSPGPSGTISNVVALNNIVRFADWSPRPTSTAGGFYCTHIHNAVFGNNLVALGTAGALRLRSCPSGSIAPPKPSKLCDGDIPVVPPSTLPPCLDLLPSGYRRAWFNNRDLLNTPLKVRYWNTNSDGFASQQQWP